MYGRRGEKPLLTVTAFVARWATRTGDSHDWQALSQPHAMGGCSRAVRGTQARQAEPRVSMRAWRHMSF